MIRFGQRQADLPGHLLVRRATGGP